MNHLKQALGWTGSALVGATVIVLIPFVFTIAAVGVMLNVVTPERKD